MKYKDAKRTLNILLLAVFFVLYGVFCFIAIDRFGNQIGLAAILPIIFGALAFEIIGGLVTAAASSVVFVIASVIGSTGISDIPFFLAGTAVLWGTGFFVGLMQRLRHRLNNEKMELEKSEVLFRTFMDNFPGLAYIDDEEMNLVAANKRHQTLFHSSDGTGKPIADFLDEAVIPEIIERHENAVDGPVVSFEPHKTEDGTIETHEAHRFPINLPDGTIYIGGFSIDRTEELEAKRQLERALEDREVLLQEVYHRVKNNLALVQSLIELRMPEIKDPADARLFTDLKDKIFSILMVHQNLYQSSSLKTVSARRYITELAMEFPFLNESGTVVNVVCEIDDVQLSTEVAVPAGLIITEALTNASKYAFPGRIEGKVTVTLKRKADELLLTVSDDGLGFDVSQTAANGEGQSTGLGMELLHGLSEQMDGSFHIESSSAGTILTIRFPSETE